MEVRFFRRVVQFLHKNKLKSEISNEKKKFINKNVFLCQFKLRIYLLLKDGMWIKHEKIAYYESSLQNLIFMVGTQKKQYIGGIL